MKTQTRFALRALAGFAAIATLASIAQVPANAASRKLLWSEEFNSKKITGVNTKYWDFDLGDGYGWGNSEQEYYTKDRANIRVNGKGQLEIIAKRIPSDSLILDRCLSCQFTSAKIKTANRLGFKYGRLEARMKLPAGKGTWPAFWMLGSGLLKGGTWPDVGEIDIMEAKGSMPNYSFGTIHGPGYNGAQGSQKGSVFESLTGALSNDYRVYAIEWKKDRIDWYVDKTLIFTASPADVAPNKWVFNNEFYLIVNLATGGNFEPDIDPMLQQATMSIDYIRYYTKDGQGKLYKRK